MRPAFVAVVLIFVCAIAPHADAAKRARPPKWTREVEDVFFDDARTQLEGERPAYGAARSSQANATSADAEDNSPTALPWSKLISPTTLETEVKRVSQSLGTAVTTPGAFKADGFKAAHRDFSELAVLFAVIGQYDGDVRWQAIAAGLRGEFAQVGFATKAGTDETYREAVERKQELAALIQGERPAVPKTAAKVDDWSQVAARPALMQRINTAHEERLTKWLTDADAFRRNREAIEHEAEVLAVLAEVIHREAYEYWDDESFAEYARELRDAATDTAAAAEADDFTKASGAVNRAGNVCTNCHAGYHG